MTAKSVASVDFDPIYWGSPKNGAIVLPDGSVVVIVPATTTTFRVYRATAPGETYSLVQTITVTQISSGSGLKWAAEPSVDGTQIMLAYRCNNLNIKSRLITVAGWTVAAEQTLYTATTIPIYSIDLAQSEGGAWACSALYQHPSTNVVGLVNFIRTTGGSWVQITTYQRGTAGTLEFATLDCAVEFHKGGTGGRRGLVIAMAMGSTSNDVGWTFAHCKINESTGAMNDSTWSVFQSGLDAVGSNVKKFAGSSTQRRIRLQRTESPGVMLVCYMTPYFVPRVTTQPVGGNTPYFSYQRVTVGRIKATQNDSANTDVQDYQYWNFSVGSMSTTHGRRRSVSFTYDEDGVPSFHVLSPYEDGSSTGGYFRSDVFRIESFSGTNPTCVRVAAGTWESPNIALTSLGEGVNGSKAWNGVNRRSPVIGYSRSTNQILETRVAELPTVSAIRPAANEVVASSKPDMTVSTRVPPYKSNTPQFQIEWQSAADVNFSVDVMNFVTGYVDYPAYSQSTPIADKTVKWVGAPIPPSNRYFRARVKDAYGNRSAWFATGSPATVRHLPSVTSLNPPRGESPTPRPYVDAAPIYPGYAVFTVAYKFSDAWDEDYQTALRATLFDENMNQVWTGGKTAATGQVAGFLVPFAYRNVPLLAGIEVWDSFDTSAGLLDTSYSWVVLYSPPTVDSISLATVDGQGFCNSNAPAFNYTTTPSLYPNVKLEVTISQAGKTIWGGSTLVFAEDGVFQVTQGILKPDQNYTVTIAVLDENGLKGSLSYNFTTKWAPPAGTTANVSTAAYNVENQATVDVTWTNATQDPDFIMWNIYRQVDTIDPDTGAVIQQGSLELVATVADIATDYLYSDYSAPSGYRVGYVVRQVVDRFGTGAIMEATNSVLVYAYPKSEGYWLIDPTPEDTANSAFQLYNVTSDSYTHKYESSIVHLIGRGNHEDRGDDLGIEGSLSAQLRGGQGTTARQKKLRLEQIRSEARSLFLRTPFGDIWFVSVGDMQIDRLAGTGLSEFCDVSIPYTEVYE